MTPIRFAAATFVLAALALPLPAQSQSIVVQVVNDSGLPDNQVYLLLGGKDIKVGSTTYKFDVSGVASVNMGLANPPPTTGTPLTCGGQNPPPNCTTPIQPVSGLKVGSPYTGATGLQVYSFTMTTVGSGVLYLSYDAGVTYPAAPTVAANYRFQPLEFTYSANPAVSSNGDLTSIDFYGIPLELTTYGADDPALGHPQDRVSYYTSTPTLLQAFNAVNPALQNAMVGKSCDASGGNCKRVPFVPGTTPYRDFLRVLGPNQLAAAGTSPLPVPMPPGAAKPWPYPTFAAYLDALANANYTFVESDNAVISAYTFNYTGTITKMSATTKASCLDPALAADGWLVKLTGTTTAGSPLFSNADICIPLPRTDAGNGSADFFIYGATQNCESLGIATTAGGTTTRYTCHDAKPDEVKPLTNSVYGWIQADVLAALNFGYMQGVADDGNGVGHSATWYNLPPVQYPFGLARRTNDGRYNLWAALMYNHSDAYGFAFSDRKGRPSPDIAFPVGGTLRVWILPDRRLDAPLVTASNAPGCPTPTTCQIALSWPTVANADHYTVTWSPPYATTSATVAQSQQATVTYTVGSLTSGTPYTFTVRAYNADGSQSSFEVPVSSHTPGSPPPITTGNAQAQIGFSWTPPNAAAPPDVYVAGNKSKYDATNKTWSTLPAIPVTAGPLATSAGLTVTGPGLAVTETIVPSVIAPNGGAALTITLGDPAQSALSLTSAFTVAMPPGVTVAANATSLALAVAPASVASGTSAALTVTLGNTTANGVALLAPFAVALPAGVAATLQAGGCPGASVTGQQVVLASGSVIPPGGCTITASVTPSAVGSVAFTSGALQTAAGTMPAASAPLSVTGSGVAVLQTITPQSIVPGGIAAMTLTLGDPTQSSLALSQPFTVAMPAGVAIATSATSLAQQVSPTSVASGTTATLTTTLGNATQAGITLAAPLYIVLPAGVTAVVANTSTCTGATAGASAITLPKGATIAAGGCTIAATLTAGSTTVGSFVLATTALQTSAGTAAAAVTPLTVTGTGLAVLQTIAPASIAPGGTATMTLTLGDSNPAKTSLTPTTAFIVNLPAGVTPTRDTPNTTCVGVSPVSLAMGPVTTPSGVCKIVATLTASTPGTVVVTTGSLQTASATAPGASAPLTVSGPTTTCSGVTQTAAGITMAPGTTASGTCTIAANLTAATPGTSVIATSSLVAGTGTAAAASAPLTVAAQSCPGVAMTSTNITMGNISMASGTCTIAGTVSAATPGPYVVTTSALATTSGTAAAATTPFAVSGASTNVTQQLVPATIPASGTAALTLTLANPTAAAVTLTDPFVDNLPTGVTTVGGNTGTCGPQVAVTGNGVSLPIGATIPAGGCTIQVAVTAVQPGSYTNTTGTLMTTGTVYPVQSVPLELRANGSTIWAQNLFLTFTGGPQAFAVGQCAPTDTCAGSGQPPTVDFNNPPRAPNFLERQAQDLTIGNGKAGNGPPFGYANTPQIGIPFTPIADKARTDVLYPALKSSRPPRESSNLCPVLKPEVCPI